MQQKLGGNKKGWIIGLDKTECFRIIRAFYREFNQEVERCDNEQSDAAESKKFWGDIWSESVDHNRDKKWLKNLQSEVYVKKQEKVDITKESLKKILGRMPNWNSSGPDLVQGFWLKNFKIRSKLKECLDSGFVPSWLTNGRTVLMRKIKAKVVSQVTTDL